MSVQSLPVITLDYSADNEYLLSATDRRTGKILAVAMSYEVEVATLRIDMQLVELGFDVYAVEDFI